MEPMDVAQGYFDAWNRRDPTAIDATFADGGSYTDPLAGTLTGPAIGAYAAGLFAAFPDLSFDLIGAAPAGDGVVAAQWLMRGTNTGPFQGLPPTGHIVALPGADFVVVDGDRIRSVTGYFDSRAVPEQLGLQVTVQPFKLGPFAFGQCTYVQPGNTGQPGAFSLTVIQVRSEAEAREVIDRSREIVGQIMGMPGFISWMGARASDRLFTITAWDEPEQARALMRNGLHRQAVARAMGPDFAVGGWTGVWTPHHLNAMWVRCTSCATMSLVEGAEPRCACGAALPRDLPYW